ncbi:hypothetical protein MJG53_017150 [Ovis ammon polii x Ovis aries]|uniref:Uncharacterized protein n=1 Tax=Ovis ammon polii x Ovis aries TaxID=2918886 RepID=A0ACB9U798_9CETA|nr:hypothetical protein MJG53_017150 [Ovis ammon polii x Ovis aries]
MKMLPPSSQPCEDADEMVLVGSGSLPTSLIGLLTPLWDESMLPETQGLPRDCGNNYFQMNSCVLAGSVQTTPQAVSGKDEQIEQSCLLATEEDAEDGPSCSVSSGDSEAKPLIFTFVPTVRRLPTHSQLGATSKYIVKIPEEPSEETPETVNRFDSSEYLTLNVGRQQEREQGALTCPSEVEDKASQGKEFKEKKPQGMQQSDLFKAEYVFIVDSEGEEEVPGRKGDQGPPVGTGPPAARPSSLAISSSLASDAVRPKTRAAGLQAPSHPERPQAMAPPQRHGQLTSPTTSEQLACKPPAFSFVSPTNQKTPPAPGELAGASVLEEFHSRRLDAHGALVEETTTYFQTSAHSAPFFAPKGTSSTSQVPQPAQLSGSPSSSPSTAQQNPGQTSEVLKKTVNSNGLSPKESPRASSSPASGASLKPSAASYIPVRIVMHSLSPSPRAFPSLFHGSSSTVCSQASSSTSLSRSGVKPPVPSRLSVLTAILKSSPSHQRPLSPASCPTFSLNSLASSTLTLDQKVKQTSPTPKKSLSSCSLRSGSPEQRENPVSDLSQPSFPFPSPTKATPPPQASALSPPKQGSSSFASVIVEKMPPPTLKSSPVTSQLQTDAYNSSKSSWSRNQICKPLLTIFYGIRESAANQKSVFSGLTLEDDETKRDDLSGRFQTKPGVIRPVPVKSKILLKKEEEVYEPNPFSKYLEDNSDFFSEQDVPVPPKPVSLHPLYQTRLHPTAKSLLRPQTRPHADCLTPGPFSHLSSFSLSDEQENSHTLFSHNAYNKIFDKYLSWQDNNSAGKFGQYTNEESTMVLDIEPLVAEDSVDTMYPRAQLTFSLEPLRPQTIAPSPSSSCPGQSKESCHRTVVLFILHTPFWIAPLLYCSNKD